MTTTNVLPHTVSLPDMATLTATEVAAPPAWALLQRELIALMEESADVMMAKYADPGGIIYFADDIDDSMSGSTIGASSMRWAPTGAYTTWPSARGTR